VKSDSEPRRFVYRTQGVCPPEIHFKIKNEILQDVRFVGGGCPGNAQLVSHLLKGRPLNEVLKYLQVIDCRNSTSCPDQLAKAIVAATSGELSPAVSFNVFNDSEQRSRVAVIGDLGGRNRELGALISAIREKGVEAIYCLGNLTGFSEDNAGLLGQIQKEGIVAITGDLDWLYATGEEPASFPTMEQKERDYLVRLPQVLSFHIGNKEGVGFFGEYIRGLNGFSDFDPFALEMNMVCDLSCFLQDETVFPALEAMTPQFSTQVVLFSQPRNWDHRTIGNVDFISLGKSLDADGLSWGLLADQGEQINFQVQQVARIQEVAADE